MKRDVGWPREKSIIRRHEPKRFQTNRSFLSGMLAIEVPEIPFGKPLNSRDAVFKNDRQPDISPVDRVLWAPAISHENKRVFTPSDRKDIGRLRLERIGDLRTGADAWIAELLPRSPNRIGGGEPGRIG